MINFNQKQGRSVFLTFACKLVVCCTN